MISFIKQKPFWIIFSLLSVVLVLVAVILFFHSSSPAIPAASPSATSTTTPVITWNPSSINETISPGGSKTLNVTFTSSENVKNVSVQVVPNLQPFVEVNPTSFTQLTKGQVVNLSVTISAKRDSPLGTFDGTVHLKVGSKTIAMPLPIIVNIGKVFRDEKNSYQIWYDPIFKISDLQSIRPGFIGGKLFSIPNDMPYLSIYVYENTSNLSLETWYLTTLSDKEYTFPDSDIRSISHIVVNRISSLQIRSTLFGDIKLRTFVPYWNKVFELETSVPDDAEIPKSYFFMLETFSFIQ